MPKICKDFSYNNKNLSDFGMIAVDFDQSTTLPLAMQRNYIQGEKTKYRHVVNHLGATDGDNLSFEIHITRDPCTTGSYLDYEVSREELREISRWLTSTNYPLWLSFEYDTPQVEDLRYCGVFDIEEESSGDILHGLRLIFKNDSSYAYTDDFTDLIRLRGNSSKMIDNDSDLLSDYNYPIMKLKTYHDEEIYLCNLSDCTIHDEGNFELGADNVASFEKLIDEVSDYASTNNYEADFVHEGSYVRPIASHTALYVNFRSKWNKSIKCMAFYNDTTGSYKIIEGGFMSIQLPASYSVTIDCRCLRIYDDSGIMIPFKDIGIQTVDYIYWLRLVSGGNEIVGYGKATDIELTRYEFRKVGAV